MSAAGTPSTDPWVILARERARYEEQFKTLKPNNGIITGDQAKGFLLQSQLPPQILGQIWALADTDADGKMDINEFSIACKLINLKLRGYEVPKGLPPSLLASLKAHTPPAIPPLPNSTMKNAVAPPPRPEPPKVAPMIGAQPLIQKQPLMTNQSLLSQAPPMQPLLSGLGGIPPSTNTGIPTGIVPPMQGSLLAGQSVMPGIQPLSNQSTAFNTSLVSGVPLSSTNPSTAPLIPGIPPLASVSPMPPVPLMSAVPPMSSVPPLATVPPISSVLPVNSVPPMSGVPLASNVPQLPSGGTVPGPTPLPNLPPISTSAAIGAVGPGSMSPVGAQTTTVVGPGATSTPRASVTNLDRVHSVECISQPEWAVPHQTKLKYTQIFNTTDRTRSGFLSGAQARNVMVQTKLPQNILAQIWALSDMDADGRLGCEEFVLAMHLCEQASLGHPPPPKLPLDLIPPSFRRSTRTASISSQGSVNVDHDPASTLLHQNSFEDKRKENFEKGQAELERRRKALLDQQRQEREERERKEREEQEKKERARQEAERKRLEELEKQMREQQEKERQLEEDRKRQAEQREAARKEMERQRQLEWEKQRLQELQQQRHREQESVLKLKAKNQSLTIELTSLNDQVKELSQKICDTRLGVSNVKTTIDGMRSTRDSQMQEMSQLKTKLKEQNAKLLALSQEKIKLEAKNKMNSQDSEQAKLAFENKDINITNLKHKIEEMQLEIDGKMTDIENNNSMLKELQNEMKTLVTECENLYNVYEQKRNTVLEMKNVNKGGDLSAWKTTDAWGDTGTTEWPVDDWAANAPAATDATPAVGEMIKYRALYEFVARNNDEISFQPGDIINVPTQQTGEPGWLAGEIRGKTGWFPESYVEPVDGIGVRDNIYSEPVYAESTEAERLEGIAEVPEVADTTNSIEPVPAEVPSLGESDAEYFIANYTYISQEPGDLTFNAGEVITVLKKEGDWWTGKLGNNVGIFPSNYVQKIDSAVKVKKPEIAQVIAPYQSTSPEQLSLARGQLIMIRKKADSGWWEGELQAKGRKRQVGWFPASYVKVLNSSGRTSGRTTPVSTSRMQQEIVIDKVIALYPYTALNPDELTFEKDDIISVTAREEESWWRGELNGVCGLFPSNYVAPLTQQYSGNKENSNSQNKPEIPSTFVPSQKRPQKNDLPSKREKPNKFRLYIGNLSKTATKDSIMKLLNEFEITYKEISFLKHFAFVDTVDQYSMNKAIETLNGYEFHSSSLVVQAAVKNKHSLKSKSSSKCLTKKNSKALQPQANVSGNRNSLTSVEKVERVDAIKVVSEVCENTPDQEVLSEIPWHQLY